MLKTAVLCFTLHLLEKVGLQPPQLLVLPPMHYGTSSAATLLVENINSSSLLEIQDNNSVSGSAYKNFSE